MERVRAVFLGLFVLGTGCSSEPAAVAPPEPAAVAPPAQLGPARIDKLEAVQLILAWLSGDQRIPGFKEDYPDAEWMKGTRPTFLVCDFLPADAPATANPKFRRISRAEYDKAFQPGLEVAYKRGSYLLIELAGETDGEVTLVVNNFLDPRAGHKYRLVFRNDGGGLRAKGQLEMVY
jgi:hypothetical protein